MAYGFNDDKSKIPVSTIEDLSLINLEIYPNISLDPGEGAVIEYSLEHISDYHPLAIIDIRTEFSKAVIKGFWISSSTSDPSESSAYFAFDNISQAAINDQATAHILYAKILPESRIEGQV